MTDDDNDRFRKVDTAIDRVRSELNEAIEGSKSAGGRAATEAREAVDELEERLRALRRREEE